MRLARNFFYLSDWHLDQKNSLSDLRTEEKRRFSRDFVAKLMLTFSFKNLLLSINYNNFSQKKIIEILVELGKVRENPWCDNRFQTLLSCSHMCLLAKPTTIVRQNSKLYVNWTQKQRLSHTPKPRSFAEKYDIKDSHVIVT